MARLPGVEPFRDKGIDITVSYGGAEEAIVQWKRVVEHRAAQERRRSE